MVLSDTVSLLNLLLGLGLDLVEMYRYRYNTNCTGTLIRLLTSERPSTYLAQYTPVLDIRSDFEQPLESVVRPYWGITFHPHSNIVPIGKLQSLGQAI